MSTPAHEIICPACGRDALLMRRPRYEGFTKVGELLSCASCGHEFASEQDVPFKYVHAPQVFTEADRGHDPKVFEEGENQRLCRHCANYVVNPFVQWCGHHKKEVEATDSCAAFHAKPPEKKAEL